MKGSNGLENWPTANENDVISGGGGAIEGEDGGRAKLIDEDLRKMVTRLLDGGR